MIRKNKRERRRRSLIREDLGSRETVARRVFSWDSKKTWRKTISFRTTFQKPFTEFKLIVPSAFAFEWILCRITKRSSVGDVVDLIHENMLAEVFSEAGIGGPYINAGVRPGDTLEFIFARRAAPVPWWAPWRRLLRHRLTAAILWNEPSDGERDSARLDTDEGDSFEAGDDAEDGGDS